MANFGIEWQQVVIAKLAQLWPGGYIGRTQLMKACYLLQVVKMVPLPYRFTLYSYGPFDKDLLFDLGVAENLGLVREEVEVFGTGYQYKISAVGDAALLEDLGGEHLEENSAAIQWVVQEFGGRTASELELIATIVYAYSESVEAERSETVESLATTVSSVKPRFDLDTIVAAVRDLKSKGLLEAIS